MTYTLLNNPAMETPAQKIASAIDAAMKNFNGGKGISQSELARGCKVPQPTISRTLKGNSIPETETLSKIIKFLGPANVILDNSVTAIIGTYKTANDDASEPQRANDPSAEIPTRIQSIIDQIILLGHQSPVIDAIEMLLAAEKITSANPAISRQKPKKSYIEPEQSQADLAKRVGIETENGETRKTGH